MSLENILLGTLVKPASGYDIKKAFDEGLSYFWSAEFGQLYPALQRMEKDGLLASRLVPSGKGPQRRVYRRTAKGTRALKKWLQDEPAMGSERFAYVGQLIFLGQLDNIAQTQEFLKQLHKKIRDRLNYMQQAMDEFNRDGKPDPDSMSLTELHEYLAVQLAIQTSQARVSWCVWAMNIINKQIERIEVANV